MTTATATVHHYEVCVRDAWNVSIVAYTTRNLEQALMYAGTDKHLNPRIFAVYADGDCTRIAF